MKPRVHKAECPQCHRIAWIVSNGDAVSCWTSWHYAMAVANLMAANLRAQAGTP